MIIQAISYGAVETARLPAEYQEVEYIESSGTQYIDTGIIPTANTKVEMSFQMVSPGTNNEAVFGVVGQFSFRWYGSGSCFRSNGGNSVDFDKTIDKSARHTVVKTATQCVIDDTYSVTNTAGTVTLSLYLFAQRAASGVSGLSKARGFSCRIYEGTTLVRDFVPCYRKSDGAGGLFDLVSGAFHGNIGTGNFTVGPDVGGTVVPPSGNFSFTYSGDYTDNRINGKGVVRLNTSGTLTVLSGKAIVSAFILGGGGGAGLHDSYGGATGAKGGGGGGKQTVEVELSAGTYEIVIGMGGAANATTGSNYKTGGTGGTTTAFGYTSTGGTGGKGAYGTNAVAGKGGTPNGSNASGTSGGAPNGGSASGWTAYPGSAGYVELTFS